MLVGQVVLEPEKKKVLDCDKGGLEEPGGVLVLVDDLPLAQETLESGWDNHTPSALARRLAAILILEL